MEKIYYLKGLDCANCAAKIERGVQGLPGVAEANVDFMNQKLAVTYQDEAAEAEAAAMQKIAQLEPDVEVSTSPSGTPVKTSCDGSCEGDIHHHETQQNQNTPQPSFWTQLQDHWDLVRIIITAVALLALVLWQPTGLVRIVSYVLVYLLIGGDIVKRAVTNLFQGEVFDENFLMTIATVGALFIGEYPEAVLVMFLYQIGEFLQDFAVDRSRKNIKELMDVRPDSARVLVGGQEQIMDPAAVTVGSLVVVNPGEKIPLDGVIKEGKSSLDTSALTGESLPKDVVAGDEILSGTINQAGRLVIETTKDYGASTVSKILELVENASSQKAPAEKFITKFARYYTPAVVLLAVLIVAVPTLFFGGDFHEWLYRGLTFLVISCPCALVISVPLSFFAGIGGASKAGVLIKGSNHLETLAKVDTVVFDKTGTLTEGKFGVDEVSGTLPENEILAYAAALEQHSSHPIAQSILKAYQGTPQAVTEVQEVAGHGITGSVQGVQAAIGNQKLLQSLGITAPEPIGVGTVLYVAVAGKYAGQIVINDQIKPDAKETIQALGQNGVKTTVMLTGDNPQVARSVAKKLGLTKFFAGLLPEDKVHHVEALTKEAQGKVAFVGDGINDAPVLVTADVGVAMGGVGSDAAIEAADVVIMNDQPSKLVQGMKISRKTLKIVKQNILFALIVKSLVMLLGTLGYASMAAAVFADVGVTLLAVLNALRCLKAK